VLFKKVCPRCGRRYPKNFPTCLECGATLIDTEKVAKKEELKKYLPILGIILLCGAIIAAVLLIVIPLVQTSLTTGQEFGTLSKIAGQTATVSYLMNQPASNGNLQITVIKIRDGAMSANSYKFLFVTVALQNLRSDSPVHVAASDFLLLDTAGNPYLPLALGENVAQDIAPLDSGSYDLMFEIPQDAEDLKIQYSYPSSGERSAQIVLFLLQ